MTGKQDKGKQIETELAKIKGNKEVINASDVVEWAKKHPKSALYTCFEWDDATAGAEHRLWQARRLIALHIVTVEGQRKTVSLTMDRAKGGGYRQIEDVVRVPDLRERMLQDALAELRRVRAKYNSLVELASVFAEIDKFDLPQEDVA
ncbi:hypothetical protein [uncultured Bradyrhizobium sp.]|uniref:hypothetical protein n=1 Tax=uncultured Bradyrhizobium sp. TaxID=199684 RepID=UPI0035CC4EFD